jgi:ABC-type transporter Mla subunit MlaD
MSNAAQTPYRITDHDINQTSAVIDSLAASGDCFVTLATQLDDLTHQQASTTHNPLLEEIIRTLLYLQRHYQVVKKPANYRQ